MMRQALGGTLDRYVARQFAAAYLTMALVVVGLFLVVDLATHLDDYLEPDKQGNRHSPWMIGRYYTLHLPFLYLQVAPFITLAAGLFTATRLERSREVLAALSAGISLRRLLVPVLMAGVMLGAFQGGLREYATRTIGFERDSLRLILDRGMPELVIQGVRFKDENGQLIELAAFLPAGRSGAGSAEPAEFLGLDAVRLVGERWLHYEARRGVWVDDPEGGYWRLQGGWLEEVDRAGGLRLPIEQLTDLFFTPQDVWTAWKGRENPLELSFREAADLSRRDPENVQVRTLQNYLVTFPLANLVLLLVGLPSLLLRERGRGAEGVGIGLVLCVGYFAADFVALTLGLQGQISPVLASWLPTLLFGSLGIVQFGSMRT